MVTLILRKAHSAFSGCACKVSVFYNIIMWGAELEGIKEGEIKITFTLDDSHPDSPATLLYSFFQVVSLKNQCFYFSPFVYENAPRN